jgi:hypothetical protein
MFGDLKSEDEKLAFALELALIEISKDKNAEGELDLVSKADNEMNKNSRKKNYLGTHAMIKLPYIIGTPEY